VSVVDRAPLPPARPVRARLELTGWLTPVADEDEQVLAFADSCPADVPFDVGLGATLLRLDLAEVLLGEAGVSTAVEPEDHAAARPDPGQRRGGTPAGRARRRAGRPPQPDPAVGRPPRRRRPARLDRFGVRFRVTGRPGGYDLRVPFAEPLAGPEGFGDAVPTLLTCSPG
jgi:hypothetical protein